MKVSQPKLLLHLEGLAVFLAAAFLYRATGASWGRFALLFFAPDLAMLGYLLGPRVGATCYNAGHTYTGPLLLALAGHLAARPVLLAIALIWAAHIGFDRLLGYGLKYGTAFKETHLGRV